MAGAVYQRAALMVGNGCYGLLLKWAVPVKGAGTPTERTRGARHRAEKQPAASRCS